VRHMSVSKEQLGISGHRGSAEMVLDIQITVGADHVWCNRIVIGRTAHIRRLTIGFGGHRLIAMIASPCWRVNDLVAHGENI
jgi:hypothetical protein